MNAEDWQDDCFSQIDDADNISVRRATNRNLHEREEKAIAEYLQEMKDQGIWKEQDVRMPAMVRYGTAHIRECFTRLREGKI